MTFRQELTQLINKHSKENGNDTPDFILANYLIETLELYDKTLKDAHEYKLREVIKMHNIASNANIKRGCHNDLIC